MNVMNSLDLKPSRKTEKKLRRQPSSPECAIPYIFLMLLVKVRPKTTLSHTVFVSMQRLVCVGKWAVSDRVSFAKLCEALLDTMKGLCCQRWANLPLWPRRCLCVNMQRARQRATNGPRKQSRHTSSILSIRAALPRCWFDRFNCTRRAHKALFQGLCSRGDFESVKGWQPPVRVLSVDGG